MISGKDYFNSNEPEWNWSNFSATIITLTSLYKLNHLKYVCLLLLLIFFCINSRRVLSHMVHSIKWEKKTLLPLFKWIPSDFWRFFLLLCLLYEFECVEFDKYDISHLWITPFSSISNSRLEIEQKWILIAPVNNISSKLRLHQIGKGYTHEQTREKEKTRNTTYSFLA